ACTPAPQAAPTSAAAPPTTAPAKPTTAAAAAASPATAGSPAASPAASPKPAASPSPAASPAASPVAATRPAAAAAPASRSPNQPAAAGAKKLKVGLVTDVGKVDDKSFNQSAWEGVQCAQKNLGADVKFIETTDPKDYGKNTEQFAQDNYDVIVTVGFGLGDDT